MWWRRGGGAYSLILSYQISIKPRVANYSLNSQCPTVVKNTWGHHITNYLPFSVIFMNFQGRFPDPRHFPLKSPTFVITETPYSFELKNLENYSQKKKNFGKQILRIRIIKRFRDLSNSWRKKNYSSLMLCKKIVR